MLKMLKFQGEFREGQSYNLTSGNFNISPVLSTFSEKMLKTGEMLKMLKLKKRKL